MAATLTLRGIMAQEKYSRFSLKSITYVGNLAQVIIRGGDSDV